MTWLDEFMLTFVALALINKHLLQVSIFFTMLVEIKWSPQCRPRSTYHHNYAGVDQKEYSCASTTYNGVLEGERDKIIQKKQHD